MFQQKRIILTALLFAYLPLFLVAMETKIKKKIEKNA